MKLFYILEESLQSLRTNVLRSILTIIGIVVGIFSVTMMLALGAGLQSNILDRFNSFSTGDISVSGDVTLADVAWMKTLPYVESVLAEQTVRSTAVTVNGSAFSPTLTLALGQYDEVAGITMVSGTAFDFTDDTLADHVAVVDERFMAAVLEETSQSATSSTISIGGQTYTIIGVMEGGNDGFGKRGDGTILVPYRSAVGTLTNTVNFSVAALNLRDQSYYEIAAKHILEALNVSRGVEKDNEDYFTVTSASEAIASAQETTSMLTLFLGLIGGIALFVGGIGTMNMMLTTVTERTKEIGLRKAIGARDRDILLQILAESVTLTLIGGLVGIVLTYITSLVADQFISADSVISLQLSSTVIIVATSVSFFVGIVFGIYPARNASRLQPVDALRAD